MTQEIEQTDYHIFPLFLSKKQRVIYENRRRAIYVNMEINEELTPREDMIFSLLLRHPLEIQSHAKLFRTYFPIVTESVPIYEIGALLRPNIFLLRQKLESVSPNLQDLIQTVRGKGLVYIPDKSVATWTPISP